MHEALLKLKAAADTNGKGSSDDDEVGEIVNDYGQAYVVLREMDTPSPVMYPPMEQQGQQEQQQQQQQLQGSVSVSRPLLSDDEYDLGDARRESEMKCMRTNDVGSRGDLTSSPPPLYSHLSREHSVRSHSFRNSTQHDSGAIAPGRRVTKRARPVPLRNHPSTGDYDNVDKTAPFPAPHKPNTTAPTAAAATTATTNNNNRSSTSISASTSTSGGDGEHSGPSRHAIANPYTNYNEAMNTDFPRTATQPQPRRSSQYMPSQFDWDYSNMEVMSSEVPGRGDGPAHGHVQQPAVHHEYEDVLEPPPLDHDYAVPDEPATTSNDDPAHAMHPRAPTWRKTSPTHLQQYQQHQQQQQQQQQEEGRLNGDGNLQANMPVPPPTVARKPTRRRPAPKRPSMALEGTHVSDDIHLDHSSANASSSSEGEDDDEADDEDEEGRGEYLRPVVRQ